MEWITQPATWIAFLTLVALELVLGVEVLPVGGQQVVHASVDAPVDVHEQGHARGIVRPRAAPQAG